MNSRAPAELFFTNKDAHACLTPRAAVSPVTPKRAQAQGGAGVMEAAFICAHAVRRHVCLLHQNDVEAQVRLNQPAGHKVIETRAQLVGHVVATDAQPIHGRGVQRGVRRQLRRLNGGL